MVHRTLEKFKLLQISVLYAKGIVFAGHYSFKVIQEIHMGLGSIPNQSKNDLDIKYGQNWKKGDYHVKKAQNLGMQLSK